MYVLSCYFLYIYLICHDHDLASKRSSLPPLIRTLAANPRSDNARRQTAGDWLSSTEASSSHWALICVPSAGGTRWQTANALCVAPQELTAARPRSFSQGAERSTRGMQEHRGRCRMVDGQRCGGSTMTRARQWQMHNHNRDMAHVT